MDLPSAGQPNGHMSVATPTNNGYGEDNKLVAAAKAANAAGDVAGGNTVPVGTGTAPAPATLNPLDAAASEAQQHTPSDLLADTEHPDEPVTAGLPVGPGPGPEALRPPAVPRITRTLDLLANSTGNPILASLASEAASRNL